MGISGSITLVMIICSLFSIGNCRSLLHEQHATLSLKVESNIEEIQRQQKHNVPNFTISDDAKFFKPPSQEAPEPHCRAVVRTRDDDPNKKFYGIGGEISLYKPEVYGGQWSSARMKIINGRESIEAGWMVNPSVFHDNEAHLFTRFMGAGKDCINTQCQGGFVQVDTVAVLGIVPSKYSTIDGAQYTWKLSIHKDPSSGHWWLSMYTQAEKIISVGYWPDTMFTSLAEHGSQIEWGGEIGNPELRTPVPSMGDGKHASYDTKACAYLSNAAYVGRNGVHDDPEDTEKLIDCDSPSNPYTVLDSGYTGSSLGRIIFFGGPQPSPLDYLEKLS